MPLFTHGDATLHYESFGTGFPVLALAPGGMRSRIDRWRSGARPGSPSVFKDPTEFLASRYRVIAMDQRNAGQSRASVRASDGWYSYTEDHLALLDHLAVERFHILGACIGVSFALRLCNVVPERIGAVVLQNPIGLVAGNRSVVDKLFFDWAESLVEREDIDRSVLPAFKVAMFGGDFVFSVSREAVQRCRVPLLLLPGEDDIHPADISRELTGLAPDISVLDPWKGEERLETTAAHVMAFLDRHTVITA